MADLSERNARYLARQLHSQEGGWEAAAAKVNLSHSGLWRIAQGKGVRVSARVLADLARACGVSAALVLVVDLEQMEST